MAWYEKLSHGFILRFHMVLRDIVWCNFLKQFFIPRYAIVETKLKNSIKSDTFFYRNHVSTWRGLAFKNALLLYYDFFYVVYIRKLILNITARKEGGNTRLPNDKQQKKFWSEWTIYLYQKRFVYLLCKTKYLHNYTFNKTKNIFKREWRSYI